MHARASRADPLPTRYVGAPVFCCSLLNVGNVYSRAHAVCCVAFAEILSTSPDLLTVRVGNSGSEDA